MIDYSVFKENIIRLAKSYENKYRIEIDDYLDNFDIIFSNKEEFIFSIEVYIDYCRVQTNKYMLDIINKEEDNFEKYEKNIIAEMRINLGAG